MAEPIEAGWEAVEDLCTATCRGLRCEGDTKHLERGDPHTATFAWFDAVPEPDCAVCSDTGQDAGEFCDCATGRALFAHLAPVVDWPAGWIGWIEGE